MIPAAISRLEALALGGSLASLGGIAATLAQSVPQQWSVLSTVGVALVGSVIAVVATVRVLYGLYAFGRSNLSELVTESVQKGLTVHIADEQERFTEVRESVASIRGELKMIRRMLHITVNEPQPEEVEP